MFYSLRLQGSALYKSEDGLTSLYLDGQTAYAEIPAIDIRKSSFSISIRFKIQDVYALGHILSDWSSPFQFRMFIYGRQVHVVLRRSGEVQFLLRMNSNRLVVDVLMIVSQKNSYARESLRENFSNISLTDVFDGFIISVKRQMRINFVRANVSFRNVANATKLKVMFNVKISFFMQVCWEKERPR